MQVRCTANIGAALGAPRVGARAHRITTTYEELEIGHVYRVYAMVLWNTTLLVLIVNKYGRPSFRPLGLFAIEDAHLPDDWEFAALHHEVEIHPPVGASQPIPVGPPLVNLSRQGVWGYHEIVSRKEHMDLLIDGDPAERDIFYAERARREPDPRT
jgi:hypothetical protein